MQKAIERAKKQRLFTFCSLISLSRRRFCRTADKIAVFAQKSDSWWKAFSHAGLSPEDRQGKRNLLKNQLTSKTNLKHAI